MTEDTFSDCYGDPGTHRRLENHTTRQHTPCSAHRGVSGRQPGNLLGIHRGFVTGIQVFQPAEGRGDHAAPHQLQRGALGAARPVPLRVHLRVRSVRANRFDRRARQPARARAAGGRCPPAAPGAPALGPRRAGRRAPGPGAPHRTRRAHAETAFLEGMWARRRRAAGAGRVTVEGHARERARHRRSPPAQRRHGLRHGRRRHGWPPPRW